jgi:hypothetical protein
MYRVAYGLLTTLLIALAACHQDSHQDSVIHHALETLLGISSPPRPPVHVEYQDTVTRDDDPPSQAWWLTYGSFKGGNIILARVVESTFPDWTFFRPELPPVLGKVLVLKSWIGAFSAGQVLHVAAVLSCNGRIDDCGSYPLRVGDELLIMTQDTKDPILATVNRTWPAAKSQALMRVLDQQELELQHPETAMDRAKHDRGMLALRECFRKASMYYPIHKAAYARCQTMDLSDLRGIKRRELETSWWGPPTWCQRLVSGTTEYLPPGFGGVGCAMEEVSVWSFGPPRTPRTPGSGLWCISKGSLRCMDMKWVSVSSRARAP